ncbi:hypothetical protein MLD38_026764 [Melastoma candidum]|uniref:Uncharacterized protein n=1 Tax=Melastoma candidum TaxID=119954 RepID=A0ACB9P2J0_9MYRT|nr:hypothetical protein MLD38_026764 [Melastoma candidum]
MKVTKTCVKLVKPKKPTPPHLRRYGLTVFDLRQIPVLINCVLFYRADGDDHEGNIDHRLARLEESLSEALVVYYPLAGRYVEEGSYIDCNDEGVEFIVGTIDVRLDEILEKDPDRPGIDFMELIKRTPRYGANLPLIVAQVFLFECGAVAIEFNFSHIVADFASAITFLKGWAMISRCGTLDEAYHPSFEVSTIFPGKEWRSGEQVRPLEIPIPGQEKLIRNRFVFDGKTLKELALGIAGDVKDDPNGAVNRPPSRVEIVLGSLWKALVKVDGWKSTGSPRPIAFETAMNLRGKAGKLTPKNAFGNLVTHVYVEARTEDREMELGGFVKAVQRMLGNARSKYGSIDNAQEFLAMFEGDWRSIDSQVGGRAEGKHAVWSTSFCGFGTYEIDFGFGKPELVVTPGPPFRFVLLMDGRGDDRGIDALVILDEDEMAQFKKEMVAFLPGMLRA